MTLTLSAGASPRILKIHQHVKVTNREHSHFGQTGSIVRIQHPTVWVALPDGKVVKASGRSVEVL